MSDSIWKTPKEIPRQEQLVAWVDRSGMHAGRFDTCYNCFCACASCFVDLRKVKKWCSLENLEDLIIQADKAERLQKAIEDLKDFITKLYLNGSITDEQLERYKNTMKRIENARHNNVRK